MGKIVVHLTNRPTNDIVNVDRLGQFVNMMAYELEQLDEDIHVGTPVPENTKLPTVKGEKARQELLDKVREGAVPKRNGGNGGEDTQSQSPVIDGTSEPVTQAEQTDKED